MPEPIIVFEDANLDCGHIDVLELSNEIELLEHYLRTSKIPKYESFYCGEPPRYFDPCDGLLMVNTYILGIKKKKVDCFHPDTQKTLLRVLSEFQRELQKAIDGNSKFGIAFL